MHSKTGKKMQGLGFNYNPNSLMGAEKKLSGQPALRLDPILTCEKWGSVGADLLLTG
jgi:hypothetical protein